MLSPFQTTVSTLQRMPVRHLWCVVALMTWAANSAAQTTTSGQTSPPPHQEDAPTTEDVVVVTASRHEERLINAPVTMTVIPESVINAAPSQTLTDLLRVVPGVNVVQTSGRDVNVAVRAATGTLADSTLVLLDGRSLYQDFFGF